MFEGFHGHVSWVALSNFPGEQCVILLDILVFRERQQDCLKHGMSFKDVLKRQSDSGYYRNDRNQITLMKGRGRPPKQACWMQNEGSVKCTDIFYSCLLQPHETATTHVCNETSDA